MDTDYLPQTLVFTASVFLFSFLSLIRSGDSAGHAGRDENPTALSEPLLFWLKTSCIFVGVLSGLALIQSAATSEWWAVSLMAVGLLAGLFSIDRAAISLSKRYPGLSRPWSRFVSSNRRRAGRPTHGVNGHATNGNGSVSKGAAAAELEEPAITEEELISLDDRDREMLRSIIRLEATTVREVMVPRLDMDTVEADAPLEVVAETMVRRGHSRLPVYEDTIDKILGIVHARDVIAALAWSKPKNSLRNMIRPAFLIPETKRVDDLLEELQERQTQIAIVVDEYGGTEGLVTMEDVLEEIVGEIEDEFSRSRDAQVMPQPDGTVLVDAGVTTEHVEEIFGAPIDSTEVDTVGGYVYHSLGRIPQAGDIVRTDSLHIEVVSMLGRRLRKLRIRRIDEEAAKRV